MIKALLKICLYFLVDHPEVEQGGSLQEGCVSRSRPSWQHAQAHSFPSTGQYSIQQPVFYYIRWRTSVFGGIGGYTPVS